MHLGFVTLVIIMALSLRLLVTTRFVTETHSKTSWVDTCMNSTHSGCCWELMLLLVAVVSHFCGSVLSCCCCLSDLKSVDLSHQESSLTLIQVDLNCKYGEKTLSVIMKKTYLRTFHQMELGFSAECGREHRTCSCNQTLVLKV